MYCSPFHFVDASALPGDVEGRRRMLVLERKKLLAEFELAGSSSITLHGKELHRQDLFSLFEELANPESYSFHLAVWLDRGLLTFLEEARIAATNEYWNERPLYCDPAFLEYFSPYYACACNAFLQRMIQDGDEDGELPAFRHRHSLLLPHDFETAYRYVTRFFTEKKHELLSIRHRVDQGEQVTTFELRAWCNDEQIHLLNTLPGSFSAVRYNLANLLNNLCVTFDRKNASKHALAVIERAATIRSEDDGLKRLIPSNLRIIRNKQNKGFFNVNPDTGRKTPKIGWIIVLFLVIIRIASNTDGCSDRSADIRDVPSGVNSIQPTGNWPLTDSLGRRANSRDTILIHYSGADEASGRGDTGIPQVGQSPK